ncbi:3-hydroxyisobutyrate dehydrogenase [Oceanibacterium hippocampi]|uniref:3-hydroxyisobutyrate dehydrogenase n=1 Tax=Oceanibacterium hippocampi TaxID=745714 RepID=A0A1Y5SNT6_9PROT|nr:3-hydroxyisobutyrate dehydrogenase [Oceanibacterium hippocampi]SLN44610.1 3-hydroxyisobutyrate dehydrogenase [Oceanibacterium hippocampi]
MAKIGFIGVGNMGGPMARNLIKAGHEVVAFDLSEAALAAVEAAGGTRVAKAVDAAKGVGTVVTMLPQGKHVRAVYLGDQGILGVAEPDTLFIDCSTIDVATAREVVAEAVKQGHAMVDAPVSGGVGGAEAATLTFMVGGETAAFERARPYLERMGKKIVHAGGAGNGQVAKICNNMILGISMIGVSEAFVLAEKLGLDAQTFFDISSAASGQCWAMTSYCPVPGPVPASPANRGYQPGFSADNMLKDLRLSQEAAATAASATPLGEAAARLYEQYVGKDGAGTDFSGIVRMIRGE